MKIKNLPLVVGISLPIVFIVVISFSVFVPSLFVRPQYSFIYTNNNDPYYGYGQNYRYNYVVNQGSISTESFPAVINKVEQVYKADFPVLYQYDIKTNTSHKITFEDAKKYTLDPGPSSPDGYIIKYEYGHDGIFEIFGSNNNNRGYFIEKNGAR